MITEKTKPTTRSIDTEIEINAPAEVVWKALTDASELTRWFPPDARVTPGAGGSLWWSWGEEFDWQSRIEVWEPGRHLRATYTSPPAPEKDMAKALPLIMDFYLDARGGKTVLRLIHSGFGAAADWDKEYDGVRRGWGVELGSLRHYLENHQGSPRVVAWIRAKLPGSYEDAWKRLMSPAGFLQRGSLDNLRPGDRYSVSAATGDTFEGTLQYLGPPKDFCGTVESLNNALLRVHLEDCLGQPEAWLWLSTWGLPQAEVDAFRQRWQTLLDSLFPSNPV